MKWPWRRLARGAFGLSLALAAGTLASGVDPLEDLGQVRQAIAAGRYAEAAEAARRILTATEAEHGGESVQAARVIDALVESQWRGGKGRERGTEELARRALRIREQRADPGDPETATSLNNLARIHGERGDYAAARLLYERALAIREKAYGPLHSEVARSLNNLAILLKNTGDYAGSRRLHERALQIRETALGSHHPDVAVSVHNLANLLWRMGDYAQGRQMAQRAVAIWEKSYGPDHPDLARSIEGVAALALEMGDVAAARPLFERALDIAGRSLGPDHALVGSLVDNLAVTRARSGDLEGAMPLAQRALAIFERHFGPDHPEIAESLGNIGDLKLATGDPAAGRRLFERAVAVRIKAFGPDHPLVAQSLIGLARAQWMLGERAAIDTALRAEDIGRRQLQSVARGLAEREALGYAQSRPSGLDLALTLLAADRALSGDPAVVRQMWDQVALSRALVLEEMGSRHRSLSGRGDAGLSALVEALDVARGRLARLTIGGPGEEEPAAYRERLQQARSAKEAVERALALQSEPFRRQMARQRIGLAEVTAALPPQSALVAFVRFGRLTGSGDTTPVAAAAPATVASFAAFVLRPGSSAPDFVTLGPAAEIERQVLRWQQEILAIPQTLNAVAAPAAESRQREEGRRLRRLIWDPLGRPLAGARRIFVVPDGALHLVSLATLPSGGDRYLAETGPPLHYLSAERDLVPGDDRPTRGTGILVLGGPGYSEAAPPARALAAGGGPAAGEPRSRVRGPVYRGLRSACGSFAALRFQDLPAARLEAEEIAALWRARPGGEDDGPIVLLTEARAGEAAFKEEAGGRRILHLATHGFFLQGACGGDRGADENPLLLSGLALAGANRRGQSERAVDAEDGILTAEEVAALDLSGVEWAVLSGCDTGSGKVQDGEGVLGLRRAFQMAGAGTVIMSLWAVEDAAARDWMKQLYRARLGGRTTMEAVHEARLAIITQRRREGRSIHPFYWGAFVAAGDWR